MNECMSVVMFVRYEHRQEASHNTFVERKVSNYDKVLLRKRSTGFMEHETDDTVGLIA